MRSSPLLVILALTLYAGAAHAIQPVAAPPVDRATCMQELGGLVYDREKDVLAVAGQRFMDKLRVCDSSLHAAAVEAVRQQIQEDETAKFTKHSRFVIIAYSVVWGVLVATVAAMWWRQRRLLDAIAVLERKIAASVKP
jgi:hypothetical protein